MTAIVAIAALALLMIAVPVRACSGLDEQACLSSTSTSADSCCVWCGHADSADGKCVSTGTAGTCTDALDAHCGGDFDTVRALVCAISLFSPF